MFESLEDFSNRIALLSASGEKVTYGNLLDRGLTLSRNLSGRNFILSMASNTPQFVAGYVAFSRTGSVQILVSDSTTSATLSSLIATYSPGFVFYPETRTDINLDGEVRFQGEGYLLVAIRGAIQPELHPELLLLLSTSGSTGNQKFVRISDRNLRTNTTAIVDYLSINFTDRTITTMPLNYSYGLSILNTHLTAGASMVMSDSTVMTRDFWNLIKDQAVTTVGGVPYFYEMLKKLKFEYLELPAIRYLTQAGGKLGADLAREITDICLKKGWRFYIMYGQTEASPRISYLCATDHPSKSAGIGKVIPGGELWLQDSDGKTITQSDVVGELVYRGTNVSLGLAENSTDLALGDKNDGVLLTGDLAVRDKEGFYSIVGRKSRFLKVFGLRVNLDDLEEALALRGYEAACSGTDQRLLVYLTHIDERNKIEDLIFYLTGIHKNGFDLIHIDAIPRTSSGKVARARIK